MEEISEGDSQIDKFCQDEPDECHELLQLEISKKEKPIKQSKDAIFHFPAIVKEIPHRESILRILPTAENRSFMLMGQDGLISFWSLALKITKSRSLFVQEENRKFKWITDFILINQYNKFVIGTCDREIRIYELSNFEPYCQIIGLDSMPLRLDYSSTGDDECIILYGDEQGCVNIFLVSMMGECLRNWTKGPTVDGIPSVTIEKLSDSRQISYIRWNVHDDWVTEVKYIHSIKSVVSSCNEEDTALVIGCVRSTKSFQQKMKEIQDAIQNRNSQPQATVTVLQKRLSCDETVFIISKGAKTFDFCEEKNLVVTGGLDKIVRLWNPRLPRRPTGLLQGHNSPIVFLNVDAGACRIFSIAIDKIIKIWDIEDQTCLITVNPTTSKISGDLAACYYSQELKALYIATDSLALLQLRGRQEQSKGVSHKKPVLCCLYNKLMRQIVTGCEGSVVKVWDLNTGSPVLEFTRAHGDAAITCMTFDTSERRLITGSRDGNVKKWNFQNGQCIQTLRQVGNRTEEVSDCIYAEIYKNGFIISVGWDKRINVFPDIQYHCDTQYPSLHWVEEAENGHKDDILSVVLCAANLLATSSYDGEIIIWNFVSGLIFCRLHSPASTPLQQLSDEDLSINKLLCIRSRALCKKTSATLVSSGPRGCIHFWNIFHGGKLLAHFLCSAHKTTVTSMVLGEDSSLLCAADHSGYIYIFHILHYALCGPETHPPETLAHWKAHDCSVTSIGLVEEYQLLVTSSVDCTVKLWNVKGEFVDYYCPGFNKNMYNSGLKRDLAFGIFGQGEQWNIQRGISEKNQEQSIISKELTLQCDTGTNERVKSKSEVALFLLKKKYQEVTNDIEQVDSLMKIRLHEQKLKCIEKQEIYGRLTAYQSLHCHELADISMKIQKPDPAELLPT